MALPVIALSSAVALAAPALAPAITASVVANVTNKVLKETTEQDIVSAINSMSTGIQGKLQTGTGHNLAVAVELAATEIRNSIGVSIDGTWYDFGKLVELGYVGVKEGHLHINIVPSEESQEHSERWWSGAE